MADHLKPNSAVDAANLALDPDDAVDDAPQTSTLPLIESDDLEVGIWEISPGVATDVEASETFVVLSGAATVDFLDGGATLYLSAGTMGRLAAGARTRWTVTETLRKVYITPA